VILHGLKPRTVANKEPCSDLFCVGRLDYDQSEQSDVLCSKFKHFGGSCYIVKQPHYLVSFGF
jgi:hypothetical protein